MKDEAVLIVALQEVDQKAFDLFTLPGWQSVKGSSDNDDRLQIVFDPTRFELLETKEPTE
ncbi:MAG: hypothetical protein ABL888_04690 [Pirellulaceae bacterium]